MALISDISTTGARLFSRNRLEVGTEVTLDLYLADEEQPRPAEGHVVRSARREDEVADVWQWEIGVTFAEPLTEYAEEIASLCERQEAVGVLRPDEQKAEE